MMNSYQKVVSEVSLKLAEDCGITIDLPEKATNDIRYTSITKPDADGDGMKLDGYKGSYFISRCHVNFEDIEDKSTLDENFSTYNGTIAVVRQCNFTNGIKLALCGNGDNPAEDKHSIVVFDGCLFNNFGRRAPEAQDGCMVIMNNCTIRNWGVGEYFDVRSFAGWAHNYGRIYCFDCTFEQDKFWQCSPWQMIKDIANHVGNDFNDHCLSWRSFIPGVCRGLMATDEGEVHAYRCTANKPWIRIEGQHA